MKRIRRLLIANRGEIACRIARSAQAHGIATIAVFTDVDRGAMHAGSCDEAVYLGEEGHGSPYLDVAKIVAAAKQARADAVHPGFGFLSERAEFAEAVQAAGLIWVGPRPEVMTALGRKDAAKALAQLVGVPVVPGWSVGERLTSDPLRRPEQLVAMCGKAAAVGFPLLIKAVAGGGGRGMRVVRSAELLALELDMAGREAETAFGDGTLLVERYIASGRHLEVQIIGDQQGTVLHLGERECSVQRRHQKIVEEAPSPRVDDALRTALCSAAVSLAQQVGYTSAGTVEFLLDDATGEFFFLEVNARIQVHHPLTELVTGLDLVALQLHVAQGLPLGFAQNSVVLRGHAIEARLCAEDPQQGFLPQSGRVWRWRPPVGDSIRVDHGLAAQDQIPVHYDAMVAKVVAWGPDRATAIGRLDRALASIQLFGVGHNRNYLQQVLQTLEFRTGRYTTQFVERHPPAVAPPAQDQDLVAAALWLHGASLAKRFRSNPWRPEVLVLRPQGEAELHLALLPKGNSQFLWGISRIPDPLLAQLPNCKHDAELVERRDDGVVVTLDGVRKQWDVCEAGSWLYVQSAHGRAVAVQEGSLLPAPAPPTVSEGSVVAPMAAVVTVVYVEPGQAVAADEPLLAMEAMKMLTLLRAPAAGVVRAVYAQVGDAVAAGAVMVELAAATPAN